MQISTVERSKAQLNATKSPQSRMSFDGLFAKLLEREFEVTMSQISTIKMTPKGSVVLPECVKEKLNLDEDSQFVVMMEPNKDTITLKLINPSVAVEFSELVNNVCKSAKKAGLTPKALESIVKRARRAK